MSRNSGVQTIRTCRFDQLSQIKRVDRKTEIFSISANAKKETFVSFVSPGLILTKMRLFGTKHFCMYCSTESGKNDCSVHRTVKSIRKRNVVVRLSLRPSRISFAVS